MARATTSVKKAFDTQADLKGHREHCAPAATVLASLDSGPRQQVRIHRNGEFALYTVSELLHETTDSVVRMGLGGRQRLQADGEFEGVLDTKVVDPDLNDKDARDAGELVERLADDDVTQTHLIAIAPHGGDIEEHTDEQAERVAERLGPQLASAWRAKGWGTDGGAFVRWHITSTDINPICFPLLNSVMSRRFAHAVAFHGFNDEPGVLIGTPARTTAATSPTSWPTSSARQRRLASRGPAGSRAPWLGCGRRRNHSSTACAGDTMAEAVGGRAGGRDPRRPRTARGC